MTTEQITEALDACELGGGLAVNGACPVHGGDNCLVRFDRVQDWVSCPTCNGSGQITVEFMVDSSGYMVCPDCVGGLQPSPELVERVAQGFAKFFEDWCDDAPYWPTDDLMIHNHDIREDAKAVLLASRQGDTR